ncbi:hypothetical protein CIG19_02255 [Enterobacterales bacterium CwR94]|nr:hypothetical protein CIG19_02255 [Enterobacterales bacterium CwR94]
MDAHRQNTLTEPGLHYSFRTSLSKGEYYAIEPLYSPPHGAQPIVDDQTGICIGYSVAQAPGLWRIYDADGRFAAMEMSPLESTLIEPLDIALFTYGVFRLLRTGRTLYETRALQRLKIALSEATQNVLRGRFKSGLTAICLKFTPTAAACMNEPDRYIPQLILKKAIYYGSRTDNEAVIGQSEYQIAISRLSRRNIGHAVVFAPKKYTLHLFVRNKDWTVMHFEIKEFK